MDKLKTQNNSDVSTLQSKDQQKKPYQTPQILSNEKLEAAAVTCDPPEAPFGKTVGGLGSVCTTLGS